MLVPAASTMLPPQVLKGQLLYPLTCSATCELSSFGDIDRRDFYLLSNIMGLNGALNVVLTAPKNTFEKLSNVSFQKS